MQPARRTANVPILLTSRWRFGLFFAVWALGAFVLWQLFGVSRAFVLGFDIAAAIFIVLTVLLMRGASPHRMRAIAARADANRAVLLAVAGFVIAAIMAALIVEVVADHGRAHFALLAIVITLPLAWVFSNLVYALHYAHLYYSPRHGGGDRAGIDFPGTDEPDYWDFCYFTMTLGMAFQTSDIAISSPAIRRVALGHCLLAFAFNLGIVAISVNVLSNR